MKFANENEIYNIHETIEEKPSIIIDENQTYSANISSTNNDCFYIQILPDGNLHACEMEELLQICDRESQDSWSLDDLCIVKNDEQKYFRGKILTIVENRYDVQCIDYGNILENRTLEQLSKLPNEETFKQSPIAYQCRLYGLDDQQQQKAIEEVIKHIPSIERVTITVEDNRNNSCLYVKLIREDNQVVNDQYLIDNKVENNFFSFSF